MPLSPTTSLRPPALQDVIDTIAPALETTVADGPVLILTYNEPLDEKSTPEAGDFSVEVVDSGTRKTLSPKVSNVAINDAKVRLTLDRGGPAPGQGDSGLHARKRSHPRQVREPIRKDCHPVHRQ